VNDLADPFGATAAGARMRAYADLARSGEVVPITLPNGLPAKLVSSYAGVRQVLNDPRLRKARTPMAVKMQTLRPELVPAFGSHMLVVDGEDHDRLRRLVGAAFTRRRVELLEPRIAEIVAELLAELAQEASDEPVDIMARYAYPLPMTVICDLLGVDHEVRDRFHITTQTFMAGTFVSDEDYGSAVDELIVLLRDLLVARRDHPADDLISALIAVRDGGDRLSEDELTSMIMVLVIAGHETTVNLIGNGLVALLEHPDQLARLREEPELIAGAVEEVLRFEGPVQTTFPVVAAEALEVAGVRIEPGEIVVPALLSANRDPARFPNPDVLDVGREPTSHVAFGHGIHHCLGAALARMEARIAFDGLLGRFPDLTLAVDPTALVRGPGFLFHGFPALPVRLGKSAV
jgi:cytochrome P450